MSKPILTTERLSFRAFTPVDFELMALLHREPLVGRYFGGSWSDDKVHEAVEAFAAEHAELGHSKWLAFLHDGRFVGRAGVSHWDHTGELELGYALLPAFWGQGLATEAARAVAAYAFDVTAADHLIGFTHLENVGSQRVLERIGMVRQPDADIGAGEPGELSAVYRLDRP